MAQGCAQLLLGRDARPDERLAGDRASSYEFAGDEVVGTARYLLKRILEASA
jgi:hypothetical protein